MRHGRACLALLNDQTIEASEWLDKICKIPADRPGLPGGQARRWQSRAAMLRPLSVPDTVREYCMFNGFRRWREDRRLAALDVPVATWETAIADWPVAARYQGEDRQRLRELALRFLLRKGFASGAGLTITDTMRLKVATMAAVPVLNLGLDWYDGWYTVVLYEGAFIPSHHGPDEFGLVHEEPDVLSGEAWEQGPVVLSWEDVCAASAEEGYNVVLHEMAHKLDMRRDGANGAPPLHGLDGARWHDTFTAAWDDLTEREQQGRPMPVDSYALENPGEFFAVVTECFFEAPARLQQAWPALYIELSRFYRQDPLAQQMALSPA